MLSELRIENFAIIDHLELAIKPGLTTFTGETGAGKSIILDAISALLGGRVDNTAIRAGAERASVEGVFHLSEANRGILTEILTREELLDDTEVLTLARELRQNGRSVGRVNGRSVSLGLLAEIGEYLVDIHGQTEHLSLLKVRQHLTLLDKYAGCQAEFETYHTLYRQLRRVQKDLADLRRSEQDAARKIDLLEFQAGEIETARLLEDEEDGLRQERTRLANAENLSSLAQQVISLLEEGTPEAPAAADLLGQAAAALDALVRIDSGQTNAAAQLRTLQEMAEETSRELRMYLETIEFNPRRLEQVEERLDLIQRLKRKYGGTVAAVLAYARSARAELETITHASERIAELEVEEKDLLEKLAAAAAALSAQRQQAAQSLAKGVEVELDDLNMAGAQFAVDIQRHPDPHGLALEGGQTAAFDENGVDQVEFLIAPNPGEGLKPLVKIASGGETSRLMLALKNVLTSADSIPTLIFDEIDQGIGGRAGSIVGEKLWQLGAHHQVLCVTHLPQLAVYGDQHYSVRKLVEAGRTVTRVAVLDGDTRLEELAGMLGAVTETNLKAANESLKKARERAETLQKKRA
jgi:DNA repair protein RecN (Recombination protein N)